MGRLLAITILALFMAFTLTAALLVGSSQPLAHAQAHNAYWPYSVETSIRDR